MRYKISVDNSKFDIEIGEIQAGTAEVAVNGETFQVNIENYAEVVAEKGLHLQKTMTAVPPTAAGSVPQRIVATAAPGPSNMGEGAVVAPIPGLILKINVKVGDAVKAGQTVAIMEAMKMENNISSNISGTVTSIRAGEGSQVTTGDVIMEIG